MNELLSMIGVDSSDTRIVRGMHEDSRKVSEDWLFLARSGMRGNGKEHVQEALAHGAAVLMEEQCDLEGVYICEDLSKAQIILGKALYPDLCEGMLCIGVTGTSGKSSTSAFLYQMLSAAMPCVRIGTHQVSGAGWEEEIANTTPPLCELIRLIEMARARQVRCVIMEVSSHAIAEKRIALLRFDHLIYTNIREDHLDFHHCAAHYRYTKYALRHYLKPGGQVIVNHDDPGLRQLCSLLDGHCTTFGHVASHFQIVKERCERSGIHFTVNEYVCHAALYGRFQVMNIVPALIVARQLGFSCAWIEAKVAELRPLKGRMQKLWDHPLVFVDYAHTEDAVCRLFDSLSDLSHERVITVIGCGGEREQKKRAAIAALASACSDLCIFTADNPRGEALSSILLQMRAAAGACMVFEERAHAIKFAVENSGNDDIILVVGKGDEKIQIVAGERVPFDDSKILLRLLKTREDG